MKVGQIGPTFVDPGKMVNFWRVKSVVSFSTLKMRKSKKNEHLYTHTLTCMRENVMVRANLPPPSQIGLTIFIEGALSSFHWDPIRKTSHWQSQVVEYFLAIHL